MKPKGLAVLLNVSQAQIARILNDVSEGDGRSVRVNRTMLDQWRREMRDAEMYLREWFKSDD